jgi:hypothetical protein
MRGALTMAKTSSLATLLPGQWTGRSNGTGLYTKRPQSKSQPLSIGEGALRGKGPKIILFLLLQRLRIRNRSPRRSASTSLGVSSFLGLGGGETPIQLPFRTLVSMENKQPCRQVSKSGSLLCAASVYGNVHQITVNADVECLSR